MESYNEWIESLNTSNSWMILAIACVSIVLGYFAYTYFFKEKKEETSGFASMNACPMVGSPIQHSSLEESFQSSDEDTMQSAYPQEEYYHQGVGDDENNDDDDYENGDVENV